MNAAKTTILLFWIALVASLWNGSGLTAVASESRTWEKTLATARGEYQGVSDLYQNIYQNPSSGPTADSILSGTLQTEANIATLGLYGMGTGFYTGITTGDYSQAQSASLNALMMAPGASQLDGALNGATAATEDTLSTTLTADSTAPANTITLPTGLTDEAARLEAEWPGQMQDLQDSGQPLNMASTSATDSTSADSSNPNLDGLTPQPGTRGTGVNRAAALEVQLVQQTGAGTLDWTPEEVQYIQQTGELPDGIVGHHINNVAQYPDWAGDPRNIQFVRGQAGNLDAHGGSFQNPTTGPLIDRQTMLQQATQTPGN